VQKLIKFTSRINDSRQQKKVWHTMTEVLLVVLLATLCNADKITEIALWGAYRLKLLRKYAPYEHGAPSHDTIGRVLAIISPVEFRRLLIVWNNTLNLEEGKALKRLLALDGKTMRGNAGKGEDALHVLTAYSVEDGVCFGQKSANSKGKEVPMIKELLGMLKLKGHIITIDAAGTQTEIAKMIAEGEGDYVLAVKGNQPTTEKALEEYFEDEDLREGIPAKNYLKVSERARGQDEVREYYQTDDEDIMKLLRGKWAGLRSIGMARMTVYYDDGSPPTVDDRYFISSLKPNIKEFARAVRGHWGVESMHWLLDVLFGEDASKVLEKNIAENLNIARKWALAILKRWDLGKKHSMRQKRFILGVAPEEMIESLFCI
jgi:predicted transposase YbfD/YdcC